MDTRQTETRRHTESHGTASQKQCIASYLGTVPYGPALRLQEELVQARSNGDIPDVLLLLQHMPVMTLGRFQGKNNLISTPDELRSQGIELFPTNRGGSITYHGPGQLTGYPIINIRERRLGLREYVWNLEEVTIRFLQSLGVQGRREEEHRGVWVDNKKICSIGINVSRFVTMHGFAFNISNDLSYFKHIRPCGMEAEVMTSLKELLDRHITVESIIDSFIDHFAGVFHLKVERRDHQWQAILDGRNG